MYSKQGLRASRLEIMGAEDCTECIGISVPWGNGDKSSGDTLKLVMVYRPPRDPGSEADDGNSARLIQSLSTLEGNVVVYGDFNMPGIDWERDWSSSAGETMLLDMLGDKFWHQLVREPTHIGGNTIDLVITSSPELVAGVETPSPLVANGDHFMHATTLVGPDRDNDSMEEVPDWSKADFGAIRSDIEAINWEDEFSDKSGQECLDIFYEVINRETEKNIPKKLRRKSSRPIWMTKNIMRLLRKKRRLWKNYTTHPYYRDDYESLQAYKGVQNEVKKAVKQAKRKFEKNLAKSAKKNPKQFFSYLKKKSSNRVSVGPLKVGVELVSDNTEMAGMLNNYFCSVFTQEDLTNMKEPEQLYKGDKLLDEVDFTADKVEKKLSGLKPSAAPGPDGVWTKILHHLAFSGGSGSRDVA